MQEQHDKNIIFFLKGTESWVLIDLLTLKEVLFSDWFCVIKQP